MSSALTKPTPQTWTLRLKHHRTTILLHVDPLQSLSSIKSELLKAVSQTHPDGTLNNVTIPQRASDVMLAKPVDINDLEAGWESLEPKGVIDGVFEDEGAGKGKGKVSMVKNNKTAATGGKNALRDCPQGVGLRDGGVVAFKFRVQDAEKDGRVRGDVDGDAVIDIGEEEEENEKWDVVVPSLEETYGEALPVVEGVDEVG